MSNQKKQKPAAALWRGSPVSAPVTAQPTAATHSNAQSGTQASHRILWRGVETTTESNDAQRHPAGAAKAATPGVWRGHEVATSPVDSSQATTVAPAAPRAVQATPVTGSSQELTSDTSLDDLFKAILGDQAGDVDDRALLLETVEAQVRGIRDELGLPAPVVEMPKPVAVVAQTDADTDTTLDSVAAERSSKRIPGLFKMVAGLALSRFSHS